MTVVATQVDTRARNSVAERRYCATGNRAPHLHALVADGVRVQGAPETQPTFHALPEPSKAELAAVAWSTCAAVVVTSEVLDQSVAAQGGRVSSMRWCVRSVTSKASRSHKRRVHPMSAASAIADCPKKTRRVSRKELVKRRQSPTSPQAFATC